MSKGRTASEPYDACILHREIERERFRASRPAPSSVVDIEVGCITRSRPLIYLFEEEEDMHERTSSRVHSRSSLWPVNTAPAPRRGMQTPPWTPAAVGIIACTTSGPRVTEEEEASRAENKNTDSFHHECARARARARAHAHSGSLAPAKGCTLVHSLYLTSVFPFPICCSRSIDEPGLSPDILPASLSPSFFFFGVVVVVVVVVALRSFRVAGHARQANTPIAMDRPQRKMMTV